MCAEVMGRVETLRLCRDHRPVEGNRQCFEAHVMHEYGQQVQDCWVPFPRLATFWVGFTEGSVRGGRRHGSLVALTTT